MVGFSTVPQALRAGVAPMAGTPLVECALALLSRFPPDSDHQPYVDYVDPLSRSLAGTTHSFAVLLSAL